MGPWTVVLRFWRRLQGNSRFIASHSSKSDCSRDSDWSFASSKVWSSHTAGPGRLDVRRVVRTETSQHGRIRDRPHMRLRARGDFTAESDIRQNHFQQPRASLFILLSIILPNIFLSHFYYSKRSPSPTGWPLQMISRRHCF